MAPEKCPTCDDPALDPHPCPYAEELGDGDKLCTCCQNCSYQCAQDI